MGNGEDASSLWERIKRRFQGRRTGSRGSAGFSADGEGVETSEDPASAETLFQAMNPVRESGSLPRRAAPLDFGGAVFGFSAGDRSDPQASADPGPFADAGPGATDNSQ